MVSSVLGGSGGRATTPQSATSPDPTTAVARMTATYHSVLPWRPTTALTMAPPCSDPFRTSYQSQVDDWDTMHDCARSSFWPANFLSKRVRCNRFSITRENGNQYH